MAAILNQDRDILPCLTLGYLLTPLFFYFSEAPPLVFLRRKSNMLTISVARGVRVRFDLAIEKA